MLSFHAKCPKCGDDIEFDELDGSEFGALIEDARDSGYDAGKADGAIEECEEIESRIHSPDRLLFELSVAVERGDRGEARYLLERVASVFGHNAEEQVQRGRFSPRALREVA